MKKLLRRFDFYLGWLIVAAALVLRLWKIDQYMNFLGDEGRDALVVMKIIMEGNWPFIGPPTSVGNMYLGPLYYYMMVLPMWISQLNPVSAAVMIALISAAAAGMIYVLGRRWFGIWGAAVAAVLYTISPVTITYGKSSWNPNPAPFFSLIIFWAIDQAHRTRQFWWWSIVGGGLAAALQMHYLALALVPIVGLVWLYEFIIEYRSGLLKNFWKGSFAASGIFGVIMSPLVFFDLKHNFLNFRAFEAILTGQESNIGEKGVGINIWPILQDKLIGRYLAGGNEGLALLVSLLLIGTLVAVGYQWWRYKKSNWPIGLIGIWLVISLNIVGFYHGSIYDHYLGFVSPAPYLLLGGCVGLITNKRVRYVFAVSIIVILGYMNLIISPLRYPPNNQLARTAEVVKFLANDAGGRKFNFALLSDFNYDAAYQFLLKRDKLGVEQLPLVKTDILYVVCENKICQPVGNDKFEIAAFGWAKLEWVKDMAGVKVYKLTPNPNQPTS